MVEPAFISVCCPILRVVVSDCDSSRGESRFIVTILIILVRGVADKDGAIDSKCSLSEGAKSVLMPPHPAGEFGEDLK